MRVGRRVRYGLCLYWGMEIADRCKAVADGPVGRMIGIHAASVGESSRCRATERRSEVDEPTDHGRCRIAVNALRREIDRLRRGMDCAELSPREVVEVPCDGEADDVMGSEDGLASPAVGRMSYGVSPIGRVPKPEEALDPPREAHVPIMVNYHITNIGTLLDVLA